MIPGQPKPETATSGPTSQVLEIVDQEEQTPLLIPVLIQSLSQEEVTLAVTAPTITDWDRYHNQDCVLHLGGPGGQELTNIKAKITWSKVSDDGQSPLFLGLQMDGPSGEAFKRLRAHLTPTCQDIKGLWEQYDQIQSIPAHAHLVHHIYIAGLVLLVGGLALQITGSPSYKMLGWVLWFLGSLGIGQKLVRSFR
jgi:hypothetical protein